MIKPRLRSAAVVLGAVAAVAAASALTSPAAAAGTSVGAGGLEQGGYLELDLGATDQFRFRGSAEASPTQVQAISQGGKKCQVSPENGPLAGLAAVGGDVGIATDGLGVRAKNGGTNCGQIAGAQSLTLSLGPALSDRVITAAEVDLESKFACTASFTYLLDGTVLGADVVTLSDRSDCGPDSGGADNTRVALDVPGANAIRVQAVQGAISVEGGADTTALDGGIAERIGSDASVFELASSDGVLDCEDGLTGENVYSEDGVTITRVDLDAESGQCLPIAFALSRDGNELTFSKDLEDQPFAEFVLDIAWDPEPSVYPGRTTQIDYFDGRGFLDLAFCAGTTADPWLPSDQIPSTTEIDGGCSAGQSVTLVGGGNMQVDEKIYLKNDPRLR